MSDLMMTNGDINNTIFGDISIVDIDDDIIQSAINNILCIYGEYQFNPTLGNMVYGRRNKISTTSLRSVESDCSNAIFNDPRIDKILVMTATKDENVFGGVNIIFSIQATDGRVLSSRVAVII